MTGKRKLILSMQITLDGYVSGKNDETNWLIKDEWAWADLFNDLKDADTYLLGRKMYPAYARHWQSALKTPGSEANEIIFAKRAAATQHIVFSKGDFKPTWENTQLAHDPASEIKRLKKAAGKNIIAWGGATFAASLIELDLVDEYRLAINPTILTAGKSLFKHLHTRKNLTFISSVLLSSGLIIIRYQPRRTLVSI